MEDENKTLAEMVAERKKATPRPRKLKADPAPLEAKMVLGKLGKICEERNYAERSLRSTTQNLYKSNHKQVETFGRLYKYEGESIIQETLDYAEKNGLFIQCESKIIGVYTKIVTVEKGQKVSQAHFTHYNRNLKKAKKGDVPESYKGNFLYKEFKSQFDALLKKSPKSFTRLEDLFKLTEGSPI